VHQVQLYIDTFLRHYSLRSTVEKLRVAGASKTEVGPLEAPPGRVTWDRAGRGGTSIGPAGTPLDRAQIIASGKTLFYINPAVFCKTLPIVLKIWVRTLKGWSRVVELVAATSVGCTQVAPTSARLSFEPVGPHAQNATHKDNRDNRGSRDGTANDVGRCRPGVDAR
jgi:hypothetical protein